MILPLPHSPVSNSHSQSSYVSLVELNDGEGEGGGGAKSYDREKAWSFINHQDYLGFCMVDREGVWMLNPQTSFSTYLMFKNV
jgi:hypothetical protein